jgi:hypothetical protein
MKQKALNRNLLRTRLGSGYTYVVGRTKDGFLKIYIDTSFIKFGR